jgi:DNA helicase-2/ATP-dependent DNA helicase PcrA
LKNHLPDYKLYKESDLIIGNEKIIISTIHKAKGLEFETVTIPFCSPGNFPSFMDRTEEDRLESARTLYVALTRAKKKLIITFTNRESEFLHDIKKYFEISEV